MTWEELHREWNDEKDVIKCRTSGSTGTPGIVLLPKTQMAASARRTIEYFDITSESHLHSCISPDYIGGKMMYIRSRLSGASFSSETPSNRPLTNYDGPSISLVSVVPSQLDYIINHHSTLPSMNAILVGGSPLPESIRRKAANFTIPIYESYGMTETASHIALRRVMIPAEPFSPLAGILISSDDNNCLDIEIPGWKKIHTNDIAKIDTNGKFEIIGRSDNVIISGGMKIHPEELESRLAELLPFPVMITSEPHPLWGQSVIMIAETNPIDENLIIEACRNLLDKHQIPKKIIFKPIPRTQNGKIKRKIW